MAGIPACSSRELTSALSKVGFEISTKGGKGSHVKVTDPKSGHSTTVPAKMKSRYTAEHIIKWAVSLGYSKKEILDNL